MLFHFGQKKGWLKQDPRLTYRPPKEELHDPNPMNDDALQKFFDHVRTPMRYRPTGSDHLDWIGVGFLCLGIRPIELIHARFENVNWEERFLYIAKSHGFMPHREHLSAGAMVAAYQAGWVLDPNLFGVGKAGYRKAGTTGYPTRIMLTKCYTRIC